MNSSQNRMKTDRIESNRIDRSSFSDLKLIFFLSRDKARQFHAHVWSSTLNPRFRPSEVNGSGWSKSNRQDLYFSHQSKTHRKLIKNSSKPISQTRHLHFSGQLNRESDFFVLVSFPILKVDLAHVAHGD